MYLFISVHKYRVHVITGDVKGAGNDANVSLPYFDNVKTLRKDRCRNLKLTLINSSQAK